MIKYWRGKHQIIQRPDLMAQLKNIKNDKTRLILSMLLCDVSPVCIWLTLLVESEPRLLHWTPPALKAGSEDEEDKE